MLNIRKKLTILNNKNLFFPQKIHNFAVRILKQFKTTMPSRKVNTIPMMVVKSFVKSAKLHNRFPYVYAIISNNNNFLSFWIQQYNIHASDVFRDVKTYEDLSKWLTNAMPLRAELNLNDESSLQIFYKYVTDLTNTLIHFVLEPHSLPMRELGQIGQTTYNLSCKAILKDKFHIDEPDTRNISEIHDIEELKSRLFQKFMSSKTLTNRDDFASFIADQMAHNDKIRQLLNPDRTINDPSLQW